MGFKPGTIVVVPATLLLSYMPLSLKVICLLHHASWQSTSCIIITTSSTFMIYIHLYCFCVHTVHCPWVVWFPWTLGCPFWHVTCLYCILLLTNLLSFFLTLFSCKILRCQFPKTQRKGNMFVGSHLSGCSYVVFLYIYNTICQSDNHIACKCMDLLGRFMLLYFDRRLWQKYYVIDKMSTSSHGTQLASQVF